MIALILCWHSIHLAATFNYCINFGNLIWHTVFGRFVNHNISSFHVSPVLDLISTLNWFWFSEFKKKLQHGVYLFNNEMVRQILVKTRKHIGKEVPQRFQEGATLHNLNWKIITAHWARISYSDAKPITYFWISCSDWEAHVLFQRNSQSSKKPLFQTLII